MVIDYQNNEKELLKTFLRELYFRKDNTASSLRSKNIYDMEDAKRKKQTKEGIPYRDIEIIIRPECNLKCEYCYIHQFGNELYPKEERVSNEQILKNLDILLNYIYKKNGLYIQKWSIFSGDLFYDNFIFDIFDVFYKYLTEEHEMYRQIYTQNTTFPVVLDLPTNPTFILDDEKVKRFEEYIDKFYHIGVRVFCSISTDGKYAMSTRERAQLPDDYFDKIFAFCYKHDYFFHPMIGADNIENWIENYDWWREQIQKFGFWPKYSGHYLPMMLEVRNDNWTPEKIDTYLKLIQHMIDDRFKMCDNNLIEFTKHLFLTNDAKLEAVQSYDPIVLMYDKIFQNIHCEIQTSLHIRMNDLTIVPCHRTTYKQFEVGKFEVENNRIVDIEPLNVNLWLTIMNIRISTLPRCARCIIRPYCIAGCLGAQYESNGEIFQPCDSVCKMLLSKNTFLVYTYTKMGVFDKAKELGILTPEEEKIIADIQNLDIYQELEKHDKQCSRST